VRLLADFYREDPERVADAITGVIREVIGWTTVTGYPPDPSYTESWGFTVTDLYEEGARAQEARLRAIGLKPEEIPAFPLPMDLPPRERGARGVKLLEAGFLGPKNGPVRRDPEAVEILFDQMARAADTRAVPAGLTLQYEFGDFEPWHLRLANGSSVAERGVAGGPDVVLRFKSFDDFVDLGAARADPRLLVLRGRLRPKGKLRLLAKLPKIFPG
jgi:hypothetical protein